ncbi:hypothetical protein Q4Q54_08335 [Shewanella sp. SP2S2-4]|uniref:3-phosphoshikimate 1-carboxyvinyltransferase n=1 Tax=Shewanella scandinavica TaxID=3063538 RepID=A0ABU3G1T5_9GAMM|nr:MULTISPECIES: hypothetical protein [Shewanella]AEG09459.1 hypothetical protein Sbal175_0160 [Shewanella baltica BA175]EHQ17023.1 hypothetical protein Sbal183_4159 [Shewanella baltica OS183]KZK70134.1 hypothetical protein A1L58_15105 [Shewanella baltica]MDT3273497.1 hypothetical protein [Shewanella sp. SP2S2-4]MDT3281589.1 hypothetical protein [Shewanella sp. SP2S1-2]
MEKLEEFYIAELANIRQDPIISKLLSKLPPEISDSYTNEQLMGIRIALGDRTWGKHFVDSRGTFSLPFIKWRFYYVFLLGKNKRAYTRREKRFSLLAFSTLVLGFMLLSVLFGLLLLYLLKSSLGINIFPEISLGIWDWFKDLFN